MINHSAIPGLYSAFIELASCNAEVRKLLEQSTLPFWYPPGSLGNESASLVSAKIMTEMWFLDDDEKTERLHYPASGLVCADKPMLSAIARLNAAKDHFSEVIFCIRQGSNKKRKFDFEGAIQADPEFKTLMMSKGLARIDLTACYRNIRVLPENVSVVSWSWALQPAGVEKIMVADLIDQLQAGKYGHDDYLLKTLSSMRPTDFIAEKKPKPAQLKVNIKLDLGDDVYEWKPFSCSGPMVLPFETMLPESSISWREITDSKKRGSRCESVLESEPITPKTKLFLYKPGKMPSAENHHAA